MSQCHGCGADGWHKPWCKAVGLKAVAKPETVATDRNEPECKSCWILQNIIRDLHVKIANMPVPKRPKTAAERMAASRARRRLA